MKRYGTCSVCNRVYSLRKTGLVRTHGYRVWPQGGPDCEGSGKLAKDVAVSDAPTVVEWGHQDAVMADGDRLTWWGGDGRTLDGERVEWDEYVSGFMPEVVPYLEAVRSSVITENIRGDGRWHQNGGEPLFSDGKVLSLTLRAWGDLMAAIWTTEDDRHYSYMDFYYS